ncbi:hypothetical protein INR49_004263, partial [Caranx melampygus]
MPPEDMAPIIKDDIRVGRGHTHEVLLHKMDLRVTSLVLVLLALAEATPDRYYHVPKVTKAHYPVKSHGPVLAQKSPDIKDHQDHQDLPDLLATLKQVNLVPQVALENQVPLASLVREVDLVHLDQWVPGVHLVHLEYLDLQDSLLLENLDQLAFLEQWDTEESLALRDTLVFLVFLGPKEREELEFLGFKEHLAQSDQWVQLVCLVNLESVNLVPLAILENLVRLVYLEEMVLLGQWVHRVQLVSQAPLACQVLAKQVNLEYQAAEELQALQEPLVKRENQAQLVILVSPVPQVLLAQLVHRVQEVSKVIMVLRVQRVHKATLVPQESPVQMALKDQKDTQVRQDHREKVVRVEGQDPWDQLGPRVNPVHLEFQVQEEQMVFPAPLVLLVHLAPQESAVLTTAYPPAATPIQFGQVLYNGEQHYDPHSGVFTCQVPGLYYFSYHIHVNGANALVALYKNEEPVVFTYDEYNKGFLDQMSGSAVLMLHPGDRVYIQVPDDE